MEQKSSFSPIRIAAIALVAAIAGAVIGAVALYVKDSRSGNAPEAVATAGSNQCSARLADAKRIGEAATGDVAAMRPVDRPISIDTLVFNGPDGNPIAMDSFRGKVLLINLWATWCAPCREEMPALDALQEKRGGEDFEVIAINIDRGSDDKPKAFLAETGIKHMAYYRDKTMGVFDSLKSEGLAFGLPVTLLAGRDGCVLASMNGPAHWASDDAVKLVDAAIKEPSP